VTLPDGLILPPAPAVAVIGVIHNWTGYEGGWSLVWSEVTLSERISGHCSFTCTIYNYISNYIPESGMNVNHLTFHKMGP
jgi:hypothetical protein